MVLNGSELKVNRKSTLWGFRVQTEPRPKIDEPNLLTYVQILILSLLMLPNIFYSFWIKRYEFFIKMLSLTFIDFSFDSPFGQESVRIRKCPLRGLLYPSLWARRNFRYAQWRSIHGFRTKSSRNYDET